MGEVVISVDYDAILLLKCAEIKGNNTSAFQNNKSLAM